MLKCFNNWYRGLSALAWECTEVTRNVMQTSEASSEIYKHWPKITPNAYIWQCNCFLHSQGSQRLPWASSWFSNMIPTTLSYFDCKQNKPKLQLSRLASLQSPLAWGSWADQPLVKILAADDWTLLYRSHQWSWPLLQPGEFHAAGNRTADRLQSYLCWPHALPVLMAHAPVQSIQKLVSFRPCAKAIASCAWHAEWGKLAIAKFHAGFKTRLTLLGDAVLLA